MVGGGGDDQMEESVSWAKFGETSLKDFKWQLIQVREPLGGGGGVVVVLVVVVVVMAVVVVMVIGRDEMGVMTGEWW